MSDEVTFPQPLDSDPEDVSWALSTAQAMWTRGDRVEAVRWVKRASDEASEQGDDDRAFSLARAAADLKAVAGASVMPPAAEAPPVAVPPPAPVAQAAPVAQTMPVVIPAPPPAPITQPIHTPSPSNTATATPITPSVAPAPAARPSPSPAARPAPAPAQAKSPSSPPPAGGYPPPTAGTRPPPPAKRPVPDFKRPAPRPPSTAPAAAAPAPAAATPATDERETAVPSEPPQRAARLPSRPAGSSFGGPRPAAPPARAPMSTPTEVFTSARVDQVEDEGPPPTPRNLAPAAPPAVPAEPPPRDDVAADDGPTQSFSAAERSMVGFDSDSSTMDAPTRFIQVVQAEKALAAREGRREAAPGKLASHRVWIFRTDEGTGIKLAEGDRPEGAIEAMLVSDGDSANALLVTS